MTTVTPFLWFNDNAGEAIERYQKVFPDTEIVDESRMPDGTFFIATIRLQGQELVLMNGGPSHQLTEAFSLSVGVETQQEVDEISDALIEGGGYQDSCGWLKDAFGLSWQVVPSILGKLMSDPDPEKAGRTQAAMMQMKRLSVQGLQDAYDGKA
ncbi:putative 3-demethylubiquinone-9 3-methyltransferase (glyoxalase superfamily) [Aeromicrobium panaciterrae]|uniref:3-demethylubiquinone-9 3-methyltransferase (Glyoxalase superfamily) n=1 Tax=Aeromicrobium panaciterrae TaxID=363861 RepID=A0ABU1UKA2_9ACTN|nr:VOC family protein [Aeromicrobium panaciterrae]MDR7085599.1 putative 3-demethylubiquinone-9 3-methyltransferase (glyoxalase superfamily) [Aeromicrobium panaciterrae]